MAWKPRGHRCPNFFFPVYTYTYLLDDVITLLVVAGPVSGLGLLGAHLIVDYSALLIGDLLGHWVAVLLGDGLALGVVSSLVLGLAALLASLLVRSGAVLGVDGLVSGRAEGTMTVGGRRGAEGSQGDKREDEELEQNSRE